MCGLTGVGRRTYPRQVTSGLSPDDPAYAGQAPYTAGFLRVYDPMDCSYVKQGTSGAV